MCPYESEELAMQGMWKPGSKFHFPKPLRNGKMTTCRLYPKTFVYLASTLSPGFIPPTKNNPKPDGIDVKILNVLAEKMDFYPKYNVSRLTVQSINGMPIGEKEFRVSINPWNLYYSKVPWHKVLSNIYNKRFI